ncbi:hypothetical protein [Methylocystis echinoides]|uniref:hypothetical protein n=1 Tax=Methylocystis echinoides TaxID=29468 RepID=UPI0034262BA7
MPAAIFAPDPAAFPPIALSIADTASRKWAAAFRKLGSQTGAKPSAASQIDPWCASRRQFTGTSGGIKMKKFLLVPAIMALSNSLAFAEITITSSTQSAGGAPLAPLAPLTPPASPPTPSVTQQLKLNQLTGDTSKGGFALNKASVLQVQIPVNAGNKSLSQELTINQSIGDTSKGGDAINKATVIQGQVPLNFSAP